MWNRTRSVVLSIVVCFAVAVVLAVGLFFGPWAVVEWLTVYRGLEVGHPELTSILTTFCACFYPCAAFAFAALYCLLRLLFNIKKEEIFIAPNITYLRCISWCCFAVAAITLAGGFFYLPFLFIAVAAAFVGLMLRIVKNVMQNAVEIKAENELTI